MGEVESRAQLAVEKVVVGGEREVGGAVAHPELYARRTRSRLPNTSLSRFVLEGESPDGGTGDDRVSSAAGVQGASAETTASTRMWKLEDSSLAEAVLSVHRGVSGEPFTRSLLAAWSALRFGLWGVGM